MLSGKSNFAILFLNLKKIYISDALVLPKYTLSMKEIYLLKNNFISENRDDIDKSDIIRGDELDSDINNDFTNYEYQIKLTNKMKIELYYKHLVARNKFNLVKKVKYMKKQLKLKSYTSDYENIAIENYTSITSNYFDGILQNNFTINYIDKEYIIMDLAITLNQIIHDICKNILNIITKKIDIDIEKINNLKEQLSKQFIDDKKGQFNYACENLHVCRTYPAYSDFISDVIKEILNRPDGEIKYVVTGLAVIVKEKANYFREVLGDKLVAIINNKLEGIFHNLIKVQHFLSMIDRIITDKYKLAESNSKNKTRTKAIVILIDIIDKTFTDDDDTLAIYFDNVLKSLRKEHLVQEDIQILTEDIVHHFVEELKFNWKTQVNEEVKTLAEVIVNGKTTNENIYKYLFSKGSKYVRREHDICF